MQTENIEITNKDSVRLALEDYSVGKADFSDYLIAHIYVANGAAKTYSFDKATFDNPLFVSAY